MRLPFFCIINNFFLTSLLRLVHLCPAVPTAEKRLPLSASSSFASSHTIKQLFPPSSRMVLPNLLLTFSETILPTPVDPVKEIKGYLLSSTSKEPISASPMQRVKAALETLFFSKISTIIFVVATPQRGVVGESFHIVIFPQTAARVKFHPKTAVGKLKAVMTPISPV